eukprot:TRINITY_DN6817_c0_g1_i10.p1 TRINITY_DN6817_c0_g1~~TRINITY_DN6817_c0_g1_i10.p1  ORF type:complete len:343 (+),score=38.04 TRINITY_DN6817_c0_g1_i10:383-1411(+)
MSATGQNGNSEMKKSKDYTSADYYFDSYSHFGIHEEMLKDKVRTGSYKSAILSNHFKFKNKVVLDVGCGTGILSLFAAKAGAKHVYGVDCSSIAEQAREIVKANNMTDTVTIIQGKIEEITLPVDKVDIIISEWMGYFLLYESMLDTVLYARDKWLAPDGTIYPDKANLYICAIEDGEYKEGKIDFWTDVYGFDMSCIRKLAITEPLVDTVDHQQICTDVQRVISLDLNTMKKEDATFNTQFTLSAVRNDYIHALVAYFDVEFCASHKRLVMTTSPFSKHTHWKQTVFYMDETLNICKGEKLTGTLQCSPNSNNRRDLDIEVSLQFEGKYGQFNKLQNYRMR